jgi:hypothetical protein
MQPPEGMFCTPRHSILVPQITRSSHSELSAQARMNTS